MRTRSLVTVATALTLALVAQRAGAQTLTDPVPAPSPEPVTGRVLGVSDPCTSVGAIVTRPTQTTTVCTVRPDHVLIETGYLHTTAASTGTTATYPQTLVRIGTAVPALEIDLGVPTYERVTANGANVAGLGDTGVGIKYVLGYTSRFAYGANAYFSAPTGASGISAGGATQTYDLNYGYTLNPVFSLAATTAVQSLPSGSRRYTSFAPSLMLSASLPNASALFAVAAEFTNAVGPGTVDRTQLMAGVTRDIASRVQIDLEFGRSVGAALVRNTFIGFGASYYR